ncbi:MAG TPA: O-antigen ligase family protein [Gemmatimonadaceae bacterium]|nr:O-antigen ligase family protein [Gemmatimonadaceae bacterium]
MTNAARASADDRRPDLLVIGVGLTVVCHLWRVPDLFPVLGPLRLMILSAVACLAGLVLSRRGERSLTRLFTPVTAPLLALVALMVLSIPTSLDPQLSTVFLFKDLLPRVLLGVLIAGSIRNRRDLEWIMLATLAGCWMYTAMMMVRAPRATGPTGWTDLAMYDRNDFALLAVCALPLAIYFLRREAGRSRRIFGALTMMVLLYVIARGGSRGGFLGLTAVLGFMALRYRAVPARVRFGAVLAGALAIGVLGGTRYRTQLATLLNPTQDYNWSGRDYNGRLELWKRGRGYIADHPVVGIGLAAYTVAEGELSEVARERLAHGQEVTPLQAHDMFIQIAAELGLPALVAFVFLLWRFYRTTRDVRRALDTPRETSRPPEHALAVALTASLLGFIVCGVFLSAAYFAQFFIMVGFVGGLAKLCPVWATRRAPVAPYAPVWVGNDAAAALPPIQ